MDAVSAVAVRATGEHLGRLAGRLAANGVESYRQRSPNNAVEIATLLLDAGDTIIAIGDYHGTHKSTGKSMTAAFAHLYDVNGGRITRFRQFTDTAIVRGAMAR